MAELVEKIHESCSMAVLDGADAVYVARVPTAARIMSINLGIGTRLPAFTTSMGRVLLAGLPNDELEWMLRKSGPLQKYTAKSITDPAEMLREIETVRRQGWALVDQELEMGLRSVATPVVDCNGQPIAALNIATHASRWPIQKLTQEVLPLLKQTAAAISALLAPEAQAQGRGCAGSGAAPLHQPPRLNPLPRGALRTGTPARCNRTGWCHPA